MFAIDRAAPPLIVKIEGEIKLTIIDQGRQDSRLGRIAPTSITIDINALSIPPGPGVGSIWIQHGNHDQAAIL
jgi:hypothetical protein